jgi:ribosome biogenesis GTPase
VRPVRAAPYIPNVLETIGLDAELAATAAGWPADASLARVVRVDRGLVSVITDAGPLRVGLAGRLLSRIAVDGTEAPCTGDWCRLRHWPDDRTTLEQVLPRRTAVVRAVADERSRGQVLCANADLVGVVVALQPLPVPARVERLLALAWESGGGPLVVLTKADLVSDADEVAADLAREAPDVEVLVVDSTTGRGVEQVRDRLAGRLTLALVGASGHGKSTLSNALVGADVLGTRVIRPDGRGRHTTVRRELLPLPTGGAVIDTPGLRGVGLVDAPRGLASAFADIEELAAGCRFGDCSHQREPGCRVAEAVDAGALTVRRFESWLRLQRELRWVASRTDSRLRAERARESRRRVREARSGRP